MRSIQRSFVTQILSEFIICDIIVLFYLDEIGIVYPFCKTAETNNSEGTLNPVKSFSCVYWTHMHGALFSELYWSSGI